LAEKHQSENHDRRGKAEEQERPSESHGPLLPQIGLAQQVGGFDLGVADFNEQLADRVCIAQRPLGDWSSDSRRFVRVYFHGWLPLLAY